MLVAERMTRHPITIGPDTPVADALKRMRKEGVRRFPIVESKHGTLVGMVTEKELLYASPSPVTSLSVHELHYLLSKLTVDKVMTTELVTVSEDTPVEEAALLMIDRRISGLPVLRDGTLVGIITETDIFRTFTELFGAREEGVRLALLVPEKKDELLEITQAIANLGGNIVALGTFHGNDLSSRTLTIKVTDVARQELVEAVTALGVRVLDARECMLALAC